VGTCWWTLGVRQNLLQAGGLAVQIGYAMIGHDHVLPQMGAHESAGGHLLPWMGQLRSTREYSRALFLNDRHSFFFSMGGAIIKTVQLSQNSESYKRVYGLQKKKRYYDFDEAFTDIIMRRNIRRAHALKADPGMTKGVKVHFLVM